MTSTFAISLPITDASRRVRSVPLSEEAKTLRMSRMRLRTSGVGVDMVMLLLFESNPRKRIFLEGFHFVSVWFTGVMSVSTMRRSRRAVCCACRLVHRCI